MRNKKLDELILKAKIGNKDSFKELYQKHFFILHQVFDAYECVYDCLRDRKAQTFRHYYYFFWLAIKSYKFDGKRSFPYHVKDYFIKRTGNYLISEYMIPEELIIEKSELEQFFKKEKNNNKEIIKRKKFWNILRDMTPRMLQMNFLECHERMKSKQRVKALGGITFKNHQDRIRDINMKIRNSYFGVETIGKNKVYIREKLYKIGKTKKRN